MWLSFAYNSDQDVRWFFCL